MNIKCFCYSLLLCLVFLIAGAAQDTKPLSPLDPDQARERIQERLNLLLKYQLARDYVNAFSLMRFETEITVDEFVKVRVSGDAYRPQLKEFHSVEIGLLTPIYRFSLIFGCGEYLKEGNIVFFESQAEVEFIENDWYFMTLVGPMLGPGIGPRECTPKART